MKKLNEVISNEMIKTSLDLSVDYGELVLDNLTDDILLQEVPFIKTLVSGINLTLAVREKFFIKKLLNFLTTFHQGTIDSVKYNEFKNKLNNDHNYRDKVTETLTVMIERHIVINQSKVIANLIRSHINGFISWDRFCVLCITLEKLHPNYYKTLYEMKLKSDIELSHSYRGSTAGGSSDEYFRFNHEQEAILISSGLISPRGTHYLVSPIGKDLFKYGILELFEVQV